jgi:protein-disulfide isomerase
MAKSDGEYVFIDVRPLLMPLAVMFVGVMIMVGMLGGSAILANAVKEIKISGTTTATTDTPAAVDTTTTVTQAQIEALFTDDNIYFGDPNSPLLLVEFSDASCPYCHIAAGKNPELNKTAGTQFLLVADGGTYVAPVEEMKKLVDQGKAAFVWMYTNGHGNGELATKALYCSHEQGKFWPVHDLLMNANGYTLLNDNVKNDMAKSQVLVDYLSGVANSNDLKSCLDSGRYDGRIASDQQVAASLGISGTPGFFVNTNKYPGAYSYTEMQAVVEQYL